MTRDDLGNLFASICDVQAALEQLLASLIVVIDEYDEAEEA